jgi:hypothetical protein
MDEIYRSQFRLPYALYEQLKVSADANRRSVNAELVARLEATLSIDEILTKQRMGSYQEAAQAIQALIQENRDLYDDKAQFKRLVTDQFSKIIDDRLALLESRLLSLPGSAFGKSLK